MTEGVVDLLEVVEVDEQERQAAPASPRIRLLGEEGVEHWKR